MGIKDTKQTGIFYSESMDIMCIVYKDYTIEKYIGNETIDCIKMAFDLNVWYKSHIHPLHFFKDLWIKIAEISWE